MTTTNAEFDESYYAVLGIDRDASPRDVRQSYRRLMQHAGNHPDLGGDTATAALINKAYAVLSDPEQRGEYDLRLAVLERITMGLAFGPDSSASDLSGRCSFCGASYQGRDDPQVEECDTCYSPLRIVDHQRIEPSDQRAVARIGRRLDLTFYTHCHQTKGYPACTEDVSLHGLRLVTPRRVHPGQRIRIVSSILDAVGEVTHCVPRRLLWRPEHVAGVAFVTLRFTRSVGRFVSLAV